MVVDDSIIEVNILTLDDKILKLSLELDPLFEIRVGFKKIKKYIKRVQNDKGLDEDIEVIPNPDDLSDVDNAKVRQIIYDDCIKKFNALRLTDD